jgi:hypothetical protein
VLQVEPFGLSGSAGSTSLRIKVQGEADTTRDVFVKLYARSPWGAETQMLPMSRGSVPTGRSVP